MFDRYIAFRARFDAHRIAISRPGLQLSYAEIDARANQLAAALDEIVAPSDAPIAIFLHDPAFQAEIVFALARLGRPSCSIARGQEALVERLFQPQLIITDRPEAFAGVTSAKILHASDAWRQEVMARPHVVVPSAPRDPDSLALVVTSSGTTGLPKKIGVSWRQLEDSFSAYIANNPRALMRVTSAMGLDGPALRAALAVWSVGGQVQFASPDPAELAMALPRLEPTMLLISPIQLKALLDALPPGFRPMSDMSISVLGSHVPKALRQAARLRLTPHLVVIYGTTETGLVAKIHAADTDDEAVAGWVTPENEVQIVDEDHAPVPPGARGRIRIRSADTATSYLDDPVASAERFRDGWFYPGDIGSLSAEGLLRVDGRVDELMNFGGEKFLPLTLEERVRGCPGVADAAAFAMPGADGLSSPWIAVVRDGEAREADIFQALAMPGLPPVHIAWVDRIPRNAMGKIQRDVLQRASEAFASRY
jgi:acyl-CoA synthetase (AMP-forming)/AMP-acid ligase II